MNNVLRCTGIYLQSPSKNVHILFVSLFCGLWLILILDQREKIACAYKNEQEAKAKGLGWLYNGVVGGSNPKQDDKCQ